MEKHSGHVVRTADVIGKEVLGIDKEKLGKVEEIVLDKVGGQVRYAVLSYGGIMGMGDKLYALPWRSLDYCPEHKAFEVDIDKDKLKNAPGFNKDNWPDFADISYTKSIDDHYAF